MATEEEGAVTNQMIIEGARRWAQRDAAEGRGSPLWDMAVEAGEAAHRSIPHAIFEELFAGHTHGIAYGLGWSTEGIPGLGLLLEGVSILLALCWTISAATSAPSLGITLALLVGFTAAHLALAGLCAYLHNRMLPESWQEERSRFVYERTLEMLLPDDLKEAGMAQNSAEEPR